MTIYLVTMCLVAMCLVTMCLVTSSRVTICLVVMCLVARYLIIDGTLRLNFGYSIQLLKYYSITSICISRVYVRLIFVRLLTEQM